MPAHAPSDKSPTPVSGRAPGLLLAAVSASSLGVVTSLARLGYDRGATPFAFISWRYAAGLAVALAIALVLRTPLRVPRAALGYLAAVTVGMAMISIGYLSSVHFIPVGLAALMFYTYPVLVLALSALLERRLPGPGRSLAFLLAFVGLALALGPSLGSLDWRGIALALTASAGATLLFMTTPRATRHVSVYTLTVWSFIGGLALALLVLPRLGDYALPEVAVGWWGFALAIGFYIVGQLTNFAALRLAEPAAAALVYNLEPLVAIVAAAVILGEVLETTQYAGGALVIAALFLAGWSARR